MSEENMFNSATTEKKETPATNEVKAEVSAQPKWSLPDEVADLIGEGRKYKSEVDALRSIPHAQKHISTLEKELAEMREELYKRKAAEDVLKEIKTVRNQEERQPVGFDESHLEKLLDSKLAAKEQQRIAENNINQVRTTLVEKFGDKAEEVYLSKAKELGVGLSFLNNIIASSPKAALELFGLSRAPEKATKTTTTGGLNTAALESNQQTQKPKSVMGGAKTSDMMAAWKSASNQTNKE